MKPRVWKPKEGDTIFYVCFDNDEAIFTGKGFNVRSCNWGRIAGDCSTKFNCFESASDARKAITEIKLILTRAERPQRKRNRK